MTKKIGNGEIEIVEGDITLLDCTAIVNAANEHLVLGAGVAGAIRQRGGPSIQEECNRIGGTFVGGAVITGGGNLKARYIIHAVGPRMGEGNEDEKLRNATLNSLKLARDHKLVSIAFPAISSGIFGFPIDRCADIMLATAKTFLETEQISMKVVFCLYGQASFELFKHKAEAL